MQLQMFSQTSPEDSHEKTHRVARNTGEVFLWVGTETKRLTSAELYVHTLCRSEKDYLDDIETLEACVESLSTEWYWYRSRQVASLYILIIVDNVRDRGAVEGEADADTTRDRGAVEGVKSVSKKAYS